MVDVYNSFQSMESDQIDAGSLSFLAEKIKRLKERLIGYGWNKKEAYAFILFEFLKLPQVDWHKPENTLSFYQVKEKFKVDSEAAELILCIKQIVPNFQCENVLEYLHTVFDYSAIDYGINVFESSSDSNDNPRISRRKPKTERMSFKRNRSILLSPKRSKKVHREEEQNEKRENQIGRRQKTSVEKREEKERGKELKIVRKRKKEPLLDFDSLEKEVKKDHL